MAEPGVAHVLRHISQQHPRSRVTEHELQLKKNRYWWWPQCGRHIEDMRAHLQKHRSGVLNARGIRTDEAGRAITKKRLQTRYGR